MTDPTNQQAEDDFRFATGLQVDLVIADFAELDAAIRRLYGRSPSQKQRDQPRWLANLVDVGADEVDNIRLKPGRITSWYYINQILLDAVRKARLISTLNRMKKCIGFAYAAMAF
ncbi:hypothetical protein [Vibrio furnissii]|uniref:GspE/PulE/PilB domain-containing protein n=1 Tax=Vibrio furnissii TaxID=29494 RepID=UPI003AA8F509